MYTNFNYYTPTRVIFGAGVRQQIASELLKEKVKKVLVLYGGKSALKSGLINLIEKQLVANKIAYQCLGGVVANPHLSFVKEGVNLAKKENIDFILAVGGGSVIDSAKAIALGVKADKDVWSYFIDHNNEIKDALPLGCVTTIAAAGSEMSGDAVISDEKTGTKRDCGSDILRPRFAIMDPELTLTLPAYQTSCGVVDMMMHIMERYFNGEDNMEVTDKISEALMILIMKYGRSLYKNGQDLKARSEILWLSSLAHNGLTGCGCASGDWATHHIEHELSGLYNVAHGAGLASIWPSWARLVSKRFPQRFLSFSRNVLGCCGEGQKLIENGIQAMEEFYHDIGMPINLKELGVNVSEEDIEHMATSCLQNKTGYAFPLNKEDIISIYRAANK